MLLNIDRGKDSKLNESWREEYPRIEEMYAGIPMTSFE